MVTSNVTSESGERRRRNVVFRASANDGSLSITGGRHQLGQSSLRFTSRLLSGSPEQLSEDGGEGESGQDHTPAHGDSGESLVRTGSGIRCSSGMSTGCGSASGGSTWPALRSKPSMHSVREEEGEGDANSSDSSCSDSGSSDGAIETVDDMCGTDITAPLRDVLDSLLEPAAGVAEGPVDPVLQALSGAEATAWGRLRASTACAAAFGVPLGLLAGRAGLQGSRQTMEDRDVVFPDLNATLLLPVTCPDSAFFGVYDGHEGKEVSTMLADSLHVHVRSAPEFDTDPVAALVTGFQTLDATIVSSHTPDTLRSGSTAVVVYLRRDVAPLRSIRLYCANVGDSRAVLCRSGVAVDLSYDQTPSRADERARIEEAGGTVIKNRMYGVLGVSRSFGDLRFKNDAEECGPLIAEPEVLHEEVDPATDEFLILACDGVWDVLTSDKAVHFVRRRLLETGGDPQQAAEDLCQKALELGSGDNVSAVVVRLPSH